MSDLVVIISFGFADKPRFMGVIIIPNIGIKVVTAILCGRKLG